MVNYDPIDHYCFLIQEAINEGGSSIKEPHAGITSDMTGRWRINIEKGTPAMKEAIYANNAGIMEVFKFFEKASDAEKQQFDDLVNAGNQNAALKLVEKVLGVKFQGDLALE